MRAKELELEKELGIELLNPFYDTGRDDIYAIDAGTKTREDKSLDFINIVEKDINNIMKCDGILAYIEKTVHSIGTFCEMWEATRMDLPVFVVSPDSTMHPWIRYMCYKNGGGSFSSFELFAEYIYVLRRMECTDQIFMIQSQ